MKKIVFFLVVLVLSTHISFADNVDAKCKSYFDGCNNCSRAVFGGEMACTMMACEKQQEPKCLAYFNPEEQVTCQNIGTRSEGWYDGNGNLIKYENCGGGEKACTKEYMPVCAQPPMPPCPEGMMCAQVMPQPKTYGNKCMAEAENAQVLSQGECSDTSLGEESGASEGSVGSIETDGKVCTMEYAPVCGVKQVQCIQAPCYPVSQTYGNACAADADNAEVSYKGECISPKLESKLQNELTKILDKVPEAKKETLIEKVIKKIDVLLAKDNLSELKRSVLGYLKTLLQAY